MSPQKWLTYLNRGMLNHSSTSYLRRKRTVLAKVPSSRKYFARWVPCAGIVRPQIGRIEQLQVLVAKQDFHQCQVRLTSYLDPAPKRSVARFVLGVLEFTRAFNRTSTVYKELRWWSADDRSEGAVGSAPRAAGRAPPSLTVGHKPVTKEPRSILKHFLCYRHRREHPVAIGSPSRSAHIWLTSVSENKAWKSTYTIIVHYPPEFSYMSQVGIS